MVKHKFPISNDKNFLYNVLASDLETCNVKASENYEPLPTGVYQFNKLYESFKDGLNESELANERSKVRVFD